MGAQTDLPIPHAPAAFFFVPAHNTYKLPHTVCKQVSHKNKNKAATSGDKHSPSLSCELHMTTLIKLETTLFFLKFFSVLSNLQFLTSLWPSRLPSAK